MADATLQNILRVREAGKVETVYMNAGEAKQIKPVCYHKCGWGSNIPEMEAK